MKVYMTGPTGAIGLALIEELAKDQIPVVAICHRGSNRISRIVKSPYVKIVEANLDELSGKREELLRAMRELEDVSRQENPAGFKDASIRAASTTDEVEPNVFYHLAWEATVGAGRDDCAAQARNEAYALEAVRLAASLGCTRFVGAGSQAEYGRVAVPLTPFTPTNPENEYGAAKLRCGKATRELAHELGIEHVWPRILSVYGPNDGERTMIISMIRAMLAGKAADTTKGEQVWDYLYATDAAHAMRLIGEKGRDGAIYCVGSGVGRPLREYIDDMRDAINPALEIHYGAIPYSKKQVMHLVADLTELTRDTGFVPQICFAEGIRRTIDWVRKQSASIKEELIQEG